MASAFVLWIEKFTQTGPAVEDNKKEFYCVTNTGSQILAVRGITRSYLETLYVVDFDFAEVYGHRYGFDGGLQWPSRFAVIEWLGHQIMNPPENNLQIMPFNNDSYSSFTDDSDDDAMGEVQHKRYEDSFVKKMRSGFEGGIEIPRVYRELFTHMTETGMICLYDGDDEWDVIVVDNQIKLGWKEFVLSHGVEQGYTLTFKYTEMNKYLVTIYDVDGSCLKHPWVTRNRNTWQQGVVDLAVEEPSNTDSTTNENPPEAEVKVGEIVDPNTGN